MRLGRASLTSRATVFATGVAVSIAIGLSLAAPVAAGAPAIAITSPLNGSVSNEPTPTISGLAEDVGGVVTLRLYRGSRAEGAVLQEPSTAVIVAGTWSLGPLEPLADGMYTAQADETNFASETGTSSPVSFTVDTSPPQVMLNQPASPSDDPTPSFSGTATDSTPITVQIHEGTTTAGTIVSTASSAGTGGAWESGAASPGLPVGMYTAVAIQPSSLRGNPAGRSAPVTFSVTAIPPLAAAVTPTSPPVASFKWIPAAPHTGEPITLVSTSSAGSAPIRRFAWALEAAGDFVQGEALLVTTFPTPGAHVVQLRVSDASGLSSTIAKTMMVTTPTPTLMEPFPVVRVVGSFGSGGARIILLSVQAPVGATVRVTCHGGGCGTRSQRLVVGKAFRGGGSTRLITFRRFERPLRAGAVIEVWISRNGAIGKFTRLHIRRGEPATRVDLCLDPSGTRPMLCPA
jgi:hypothetical protein